MAAAERDHGQRSPGLHVRRSERVGVPCARCRQPVDPLRAARVACFEAGFRYFCSGVCREQYVPEPDQTPLAAPLDGPVPDSTTPTPVPAATEPAPPLAPAASSPIEVGEATGDGPRPVDGKTRGHPTLLLAATGIGILPSALLLIDPGAFGQTVQLSCVLAAFGMCARYAYESRGSMRGDWHLQVGPAIVALAALAAYGTRSQDAPIVAAIAGLVMSTSALILSTSGKDDAALERAASDIRRRLDVPGRRVVPSKTAESSSPDVDLVPAEDLRAGEELVLERGDVVPADAVVVAGTGTVRPWLDADGTSVRAPGMPLVAGSQVLDGRLRAVATWTADERAWLRILRPHDVEAGFGLAQTCRVLVRRASWLAAGTCALVTALSPSDWLVGLCLTGLVHSTFANARVTFAGFGAAMSTILAALRRGVVFRSAKDLDEAGSVSTAMFCARGTLLMGEPEVASIEAWGENTQQQVLSIAAGVQASSGDPVAVAIRRAARARNVRPAAVRNVTQLPGLGVTAMSESGRPVVVGSRGLMLREKIGVAAAEDRLADLEGSGRTVLLVAHGQRLWGLVALHDGLKPGARAAVQYLLDAGVEPVLLSGDARQTCEALGKAVDIDHVRPEVLPPDRPREIARLRAGGAIVAVIGSSPLDDLALGAASVAIAMRAAGASSTDWGIQLASDDVRDAAYALSLAHACRGQARQALTVALLPGAAAVVTMLLGAPLAAGFTLATLTALTLFATRTRTRTIPDS